jgi:hypothetical protein
MSADDPQKTTLTGKVEKKDMGGTSKSAHSSFVLQTKRGDVKLRREGGNPFYDDFFEKYEGKDIAVKALIWASIFLFLILKQPGNLHSSSLYSSNKIICLHVIILLMFFGELLFA